MNFEQELNHFEDTLVVMAEIQRRQAEMQRLQAEATKCAKVWFATNGGMEHIETTLFEVGEKLNELIGFMDNFVRRPQ